MKTKYKFQNWLCAYRIANSGIVNNWLCYAVSANIREVNM